MNVTSSAARWRAIVDRDQSVSSFVYAVRTTGIFCRPSCPARLARRANVEFFDSPAQAEKAGYRSCKRCKPQLHVLVDPHVAIVQRACEMISTSSSSQRPKLHELAAEANLTPSHFHRVFKKVVGVTPGQYARGASSSSGGKRERTSKKVRRDGSAGGLSRTDELGFDTSTTVYSVVSDGNVERSTIDWNEFDAMLAGVGGTVGWGDELQVPSLGTSDENLQNSDPLLVKGSLSSDTRAPHLNYEDVLDSISGNNTGRSMTELLRGDSYLLPSNTSGELEQSTIPISLFPFGHSDMFWNEEGFSSYQ